MVGAHLLGFTPMNLLGDTTQTEYAITDADDLRVVRSVHAKFWDAWDAYWSETGGHDKRSHRVCRWYNGRAYPLDTEFDDIVKGNLQ